MRTLKRTLALILALVMALGMMTTMTSATKLEDLGEADQVSDVYRVAMGVLVGMGVYQGDSSGNLNPTDNVTRAEMARILYAAITGDVDSKSTPAISTQVFKDVPTSHWAVGYINWAQAAGYVVGYGNGNFGPSDSVTGYQAMLMLLQALGYNKQGEIGGEGWEVETHLWAAGGKVDLMKGVAVNYSQPATREEIGQYVYNMLQRNRVFWSDDSRDYTAINNVLTRTYGLANFNYAPENDYYVSSTGEYYDNVLEASIITSLPNTKGKVKVDNSSTYSHEYDASTDEVGRVADIYQSYKGVIYYVDILSEDVLVKAGTSESNYNKTIKNEYDIASGSQYAYVFNNYELASTGVTDKTYKGTGICTSAIQAQDATYVIYEDEIYSVLSSNMTVELVVVDKDGSVTIGLSGNEIDITKKYSYKGDNDLTVKGKYYMNCVLEDGTYTLTDVTTITVAASRFYSASSSDNGKVTLNGTTYKLKLTDVGNNSDLSVQNYLDNTNGKTSDVYTWYISGVTGNVIGAKLDDSIDNNTYGYLVDSNDSLGNYYAKLVLTDGTVKTYQTDKDYASAKYSVVMVVANDDGTYALESSGFVEVIASSATDPFNKFSGSLTIKGTSTSLYNSNGNYVYLGGNKLLTSSSTLGVFTSGSVTVKEGTHSSNIFVDTSATTNPAVVYSSASTGSSQVSYAKNATIWAKYSDSNVITAAFITTGYAQGSVSDSDYYYWDGEYYNTSTSSYYVVLYNLKSGEKVEYKVGVSSNLPTSKGVYVATKDGSNYTVQKTGNYSDSTKITSLTKPSGKNYSLINGSLGIYSTTVVMDQDDRFSIGDVNDLDEDDYIAYAVDEDGYIIGAVLLKKTSTTPATSTTTLTYTIIDGTGATLVNKATASVTTGTAWSLNMAGITATNGYAQSAVLTATNATVNSSTYATTLSVTATGTNPEIVIQVKKAVTVYAKTTAGDTLTTYTRFAGDTVTYALPSGYGFDTTTTPTQTNATAGANTLYGSTATYTIDSGSAVTTAVITIPVVKQVTVAVAFADGTGTYNPTATGSVTVWADGSNSANLTIATYIPGTYTSVSSSSSSVGATLENTNTEVKLTVSDASVTAVTLTLS